MKKIFLFLILILIGGCINQNIKEPYQIPVCGDNLCEESEEYYCLDCNLSCKSEFCNSKINLICNNCTEEQKKLLPALFEHQNIIYNCLSNYYNYNPEVLTYHLISSHSKEICKRKEGCYISGGTRETEGIKQSFISGLIKYKENEVTKIEDVGFEVHELAHVFTYYGLGIVPSWFSEGISIYTESRILCHPNQILSEKIDSFSNSYEELISNKTTINEIAPYDEYYKTQHNSHVIGSLYFLFLEKNYNCNKRCISEILYSLHKYRENCTGECFEDAKKSIPQLMNLSLNNNDLRVQIITNQIVKQKSEEIVGKNLDYVFNKLEIKY